QCGEMGLNIRKLYSSRQAICGRRRQPLAPNQDERKPSPISNTSGRETNTSENGAGILPGGITGGTPTQSRGGAFAIGSQLPGGGRPRIHQAKRSRMVKCQACRPVGECPREVCLPDNRRSPRVSDIETAHVVKILEPIW